LFPEGNGIISNDLLILLNWHYFDLTEVKSLCLLHSLFSFQRAILFAAQKRLL
jgi:hypothetical protein